MSRLQSAVAWAFLQAAASPAIHSAPEPAPVVFWASDPIRPGETALVIGARFGQEPTVEVARLEDSAEIMRTVPTWPGQGQKATALQAGERSVKFVIPGDFQPGVFAYRLTGPGGIAVGLLNRPDVWWAQGDLGVSASPGGWLRVFGKNLGWEGERGSVPPSLSHSSLSRFHAFTHLLLRGPKTVTLPAEADCYTARAALPKALPAGEYRVYVHNGCGGGAAWSEAAKITIRKPQPWPPPPLAKEGAGGVFNVKDFGADGTGERDDTAAVQAALAKVQENGGGVVYFPRGRYQVSETLTIPRFTVLRGEGRELVNLFWPDAETPLPALVQGTNSFGLEDLTLYASNYGHFIVGDTGDKPEAGNVFLRRLRVRGVLYRGHLTPQQVHDRFVAFQKLSSGGGDTVQLGGENLEITDCDLYGSGRSFVLGWARGALLRGNTFYNGRWGWYDIYNSERVIFEHNQILGADLMSTGGGLSCWQTTRPCQQNIYFGHNTFQNMHGWDREAMTSDGGGGAYYGPVGDATADTLFLPAGEKWHAQDLVGMTCFVVGGKGQGQWRTVVRADERGIELDRPWEVVPDQTSLVGVVMTHRHYLLVDNEFTDCGIAIQFYGTALEHLVAGNRCTRGGGFHSIGKQYGGYDLPPEKSPAHQPDWFVQFLDNEILEGNCYRYDANNAALAGESHVGVYGWAPRADWPWPYNLGAVVRRNRLHNNAHVEVSGACAEVVVENNRIERADVGVVVNGGRGVLLRGNQFAEVRAPYTGAALPQAYLSPLGADGRPTGSAADPAARGGPPGGSGPMAGSEGPAAGG